MALLVSGGHTELNLMEDHLKYRRLGATLDDAAGEAFDKVARLFGLPIPGDHPSKKLLKVETIQLFIFREPRLEGSWDFSFSGLKTAVSACH